MVDGPVRLLKVPRAFSNYPSCARAKPCARQSISFMLQAEAFRSNTGQQRSASFRSNPLVCALVITTAASADGSAVPARSSYQGPEPIAFAKMTNILPQSTDLARPPVPMAFFNAYSAAAGIGHPFAASRMADMSSSVAVCWIMWPCWRIR